MTPKQIIAEIIRDYRYNVRMGMTEHQAQQVLADMICDYLESEKERYFEMGIKSGRFAERSEKELGKRS
jgi:hypothetical protein